MAQVMQQEFRLDSENNVRKLELARQLLGLLNAHVMSDEGARKTSFQKVDRN